jgi:SET domain-containing protein
MKTLLVTKKRSAIHSTGIFAKTDIAKGTRIIEYVGEKITAKEASRRADAFLDDHRKDRSSGAVYIFEINRRYSVDGNVPYNTARHINHSCDPNAETDVIKGRVWIIAIRDIKKGEEIAYNYGYDFIEDYEDHPCRCGAANCAGFIMHYDAWPKLRRALKKSKPSRTATAIMKR